ncbi:hypothetical protein ADK67_13485, partial [Saccharothrix sp. NRRL B-16348]
FAGGRANYVRAVHGATAVPHDLVLEQMGSPFGLVAAAVMVFRWGGTAMVTLRVPAGPRPPPRPPRGNRPAPFPPRPG